MMQRKWFSWPLFFLIFGAVLIKLVSFYPDIIEKYYALGFYPFIGRIFRWLTGWIPFSVGDVLYLIAILLILKELMDWARWLKKRQEHRFLSRKWLLYLNTTLTIYLIFNIFWGLNYNRKNIGTCFQLDRDAGTDSLLQQLSIELRDKTNQSRPKVFHLSQNYLKQVAYGYTKLSAQYPFLQPAPISLKPSLFGFLGNYMGYSGYFNPFTGEGQINTSIPAFMIPFVASHEMGHQLGFAKEYEASFVGHLAARASGDQTLQYSSYLNMYLSANRELRNIDSIAAKNIWKGLKPEVQKDIQQYRLFLQRYDSPIGLWVDAFYTRYLHLNEQPAGMRSYNLVVVWLMAWKKKYGEI